MGKYLKTHCPGVFKYVGTRGTVYGIDYYVDGKKHREIVGPLLTEARAKLEEIRAQAKRGGFVSLASRRKITFDQLMAKFSEMEKGRPYFEKSRKYWLPVLLSFFGGSNGQPGRKLCSITPYDLEEFKKRRKETPTRFGKLRGDASVNRELETLRRMFNKAIEWGMMTENPFDHFKRSILFPERHDRCRYLTEGEIQKLLAACPPCLERIVRAALLTGLRKGDLLSLQWSDIDLERRILYFTEQKKRGKRGVKVLNSDFVEPLQEIPRNGSEALFTGPNGKAVRNVRRAFGTALKKARIQDFHFHDLQHSSASYLVMRGASMRAVQAHLGHTSIAMTERYAHLSPDFLKSEIERLGGVFKLAEISKKYREKTFLDDLALTPNLPLSA